MINVSIVIKKRVSMLSVNRIGAKMIMMEVQKTVISKIMKTLNMNIKMKIIIVMRIKKREKVVTKNHVLCVLF